MTTLTIAQLLDMPPTVDLMTAATALGLGRTKAYDLAKRGEFPCRVIRVGDAYRVPTAVLLQLLGISDPDPAASHSRTPTGSPSTGLSRAS
ncbi:MAG: helix-turn-helix domain-containing protein [Streptosporangiaceae bacterium]